MALGRPSAGDRLRKVRELTEDVRGLEELEDRPPELCLSALASERIHSGYLMTGPPARSQGVARWFARALACETAGVGPCGSCPSCARSSGREEVEIDGSGKKGPLFRHIGDHPDLLWVGRGPDDTRVRIGQIRAAQAGLRLRSDGRRVLVIADASWLNAEAQNALLRLLEEPPTHTTVILQAENPASLLATVRSRCQRIAISAADCGVADEELEALRGELLELIGSGPAAQLDFAEQYRGPRGPAAEGVSALLEAGCDLLHHEATEVRAGSGRNCVPVLDAWQVLRQCRKALAQRNANPQMVAERALRALAEVDGGLSQGADGR